MKRQTLSSSSGFWSAAQFCICIWFESAADDSFRRKRAELRVPCPRCQFASLSNFHWFLETSWTYFHFSSSASDSPFSSTTASRQKFWSGSGDLGFYVWNIVLFTKQPSSWIWAWRSRPNRSAQTQHTVSAALFWSVGHSLSFHSREGQEPLLASKSLNLHLQSFFLCKSYYNHNDYHYDFCWRTNSQTDLGEKRKHERNRSNT